MRPSVTEQLDAACRLLETTIAPALADPHAGRLLSTIISDLRALASSWSGVMPFLHWDSAATCDELRNAREEVAEPLRMRIDEALAASPTVPTLHFDEANDRNDLLRQLLADLIADPATTPETRSRIAGFFVERSGRYPMRMSLSLPQSQEQDDADSA